MADLKRTIEILFQGTNRTGTAISGVGRDLDKLNYSVSSIASPFASATTAVLKLDAALVALAAAGIAYSTNQFKNFEDVMLKVKGIMGASDAQFKQLTDLTKELGATTRYTANEAAQGLEFLALAGLGFEQSMASLPTVLNLAQASATSLGTTADLLTNVMAGYGIAVGDLAKTSDVLTATFTNSNTNLTELGQAFKYVGPVAKGFGLEIEEAASILGILASSGYKAEQGGTALRNILIALVAPMGNAGKLMKELGVDTNELGVDLASSSAALASMGVSVKDAQGNLRPFAAIMNDLKVGLEKIQAPADRTAVLIEIFGKRGGPQMAALLEKGGAAVFDLENKIRSLGGITSRIAAEMESRTGGALRSLQSAFEAVAISVGGNFADGLIDPVRSVTDVFRTLSITIDQGMFDPVFDAFDRFGADLGAQLRAIADNLPTALEGVDFSGLLSSLSGIKSTLSGIFDGIDFSQPDDLERAIQKIIDSLESLTRFSDGIAGIFIKVAREILDLIDNFNDLDDETKEIFGSISGIGSVLSGVTGPIGEVTGAIKGMGLALNVLAGGQIVTLIRSLIGTGGFTAALSAVAAHPLIAAAGAGIAMGAAFRAVIPEIDAAAQSVLRFIDANTGLLGVEAQRTQNETEWQAIQERWKRIVADRKEYAQQQEEASAKAIQANKDNAVSVEWLSDEMRKLGILVEEPKVVNVDTKQAEANLQRLEYFRESTGTWETIMVPVDTNEIDKAKKAIDEIPAVKRFELETDLNVAKIKSDAKIVQTALEWTAKLEIAQAEAALGRFKAVAESVSATVASTGDTLGNLFSSYTSADSYKERNTLETAISREQTRRDNALKTQQDLAKSEIALNKSRQKRLNKKDALIKVEGDGLQAHLEMIMWELFKAIQIRASQEGIEELLLGG